MRSGPTQSSATAPDNLASTLRLRRVSLGLRQDELADLAEVSERFVYALENGKRSVQLDKLVAVLTALGLHRGSAPWITAHLDQEVQ